MSERAKTLGQQARELTPPERIALVEDLLDSLEPADPLIDSLWVLRLLDRETGPMYKEISFRSVFKPGRITAPGLVLGAIRRRCGTAAAPATALRADRRLRNSIGLAPVLFAASTCG
jgi:hypothetical protein